MLIVTVGQLQVKIIFIIQFWRGATGAWLGCKWHEVMPAMTVMLPTDHVMQLMLWFFTVLVTVVSGVYRGSVLVLTKAPVRHNATKGLIDFQATLPSGPSSTISRARHQQSTASATRHQHQHVNSSCIVPASMSSSRATIYSSSSVKNQVVTWII